jgi:nucleotide-binding universal stress UspA family protein
MHDAEESLRAIAGEDAEVHVSEGLPTDAICRVASRLHADLIVMGTHGREGLSHLLLGSVAERTLRRAPCPVLTVRAPAAAAKAS